MPIDLGGMTDEFDRVRDRQPLADFHFVATT
jgi:hypothetical protein